jgi:hypothetical protein
VRYDVGVNRSERVLLAAAVVGGAVFILVGINRPVFLDEANSVLIASRGFAGIPGALIPDNNLPAYYFVLSIWMRLFGDSEVALRLLSVAFYLGGCAAAFALGRRLTGDRRAACYSALLYGVSALAIEHAQNIRMYSMLGMLSGLSTVSFVRLFRDGKGSPRTWAWMIAVNAIGMLTHVWFVFVLAGQAVTLAVYRRGRLFSFAGGVAAAAVPFLALWGKDFIAQSHNGAANWMPPFQAAFLVAAPMEFYGPAAGMVIYSLLIGGLVLAARHRKRIPADIGWIAVCLAGSVAVPLMVTAIRPIYIPGRYMVVALPPLAATLGALLPAILPRPILAAALLLVCGIQVMKQVRDRELVQAFREMHAGLGRAENLLGDNSDPGRTMPSDRDTVTMLVQNARAGDALIFTSLSRASADYYLRRAGAQGRFVEVSFPEDVSRHLGWSDPDVGTQRPALETEAAAVAVRMRDLVRAGGRVWMYDRSNWELNQILTRDLEAELKVERVYQLAGTYHTRIVVYTSR